MIIVPKRELILPKSVRRKQGGFLLSPFRFGGGGGGSWAATADLTPGSDSVGWAGYTLRQVIPASAFVAGSRVRFRLNAAGAAGTTVNIHSAFFGKQAASGDAYDFDTTPGQLTFSGSPGVSFLATQTRTTDDLIIPVAADNHVLSIYFSGSTDVQSSTGNTGWIDYYKIGNDASTVNASGYTAGTMGRSLLVLRVEVYSP